MINQLKIARDKTKKFVREHPTVTACVVTAVVASKMTKSVTTKQMSKMVSEWAYDKGYEVAMREDLLKTALADAHTFIAETGMRTTFDKYLSDIDRV